MDFIIVATFLVAFLSSIISGMSGGGGSLVMVPFYLLLGLTPQQIVGVGSVASLGLGGSSLIAMRGKQLLHKKFLVPLTLLTIIATLLAMGILPHIKSESFTITLGFLLIALAPTLFIKKNNFQPGNRKPWQVWSGYALYAALLLGNALGGSVAPLLFLPLMFLMGLTALEATALRRVLGLIQAVIIFVVVLPQGFILWSYALASLIGCYVGGYVGTKIALKRGEGFVKLGLAITMIVSGFVLLGRYIL